MWIILGLLGFVVLVILVVAAYVVSVYNDLVRKRNNYENQFSQIDVQLKRRYDLIPNLVEVAKGYMAHEKETLEAVIQARNQSVNAAQAASKDPSDPNSMKQLMQSENQLSGTLSRLMVVSEQYPDLKANENMLSLQEELTSTENKVTYARQGYNDSVTTYNTTREQFPGVFIAQTFNFKEAQLWEIEEAEQREAPKVKF